MVKVNKLFYVCPRCDGNIAPTRAIDNDGNMYGSCSRPEAVKWVDGKRIVTDPGCRNDPPYILTNLQTRVIEVEVVVETED